MHYYKRNIGDYAKKAGRLTILQHGIYNLLIDACYDREKFPTREKAIDWVWASSQEEIDGVDLVLRKFFEEQDDGVFVQNRIETELADYHAKATTNKRIAIERETKRKEKSTKRERTVNEAPPNHKPLTKNQEPLKETRAKANRFVPPVLQDIKAYCTERKNTINPQSFLDHYESNGWMRGKNKIKDWKACVRTWENSQPKKPTGEKW